MELLELYLLFFKLGIVNFGGGYAMLPLLERELVQKRGWATSEELADYYAVGQCTPGAIAVNVSTFIGIKRKGVLGGIAATLGFVSPAFIIIFIIASLLTNFSSNEYVQNALAGIRVCIFFLVLYAVIKLVKKSIKDICGAILATTIALCAIFIDVIPLYCYVIIAGVFGLIYNLIKEKRKLKKKAEEVKNEKALATENEVNEEAVAPLEAKDVEVKKEKKEGILSIILLSTLGFIVGLALGLIGLLSTFIIRNKRYKKGVQASFLLWFILLFCVLVWIIKDTNVAFRIYLNFFKIGICAFGGGLATIPFLKELGETTGWFTHVDLANMIAVSESTPGAMGVNMSTYVGYTVLDNKLDNPVLSFFGSMMSTLGLVTPSIIVISIVSVFLSKFRNNKYVEWAFYGLRAASIGLIIAALYSILQVSLFNEYVNVDSEGVSHTLDGLKESWKLAFDNFKFKNILKCISNFFDYLFNWKNVGVGLVFGICIFKFKKHPILYIAIAAVVGILLQMAVV